MDRLLNVIKKSLATALLGLFAGLAFGFIIWGIVMAISSPDFQGPPKEIVAFLGMAFGTLVGAIFGGIVGLKEK